MDASFIYETYVKSNPEVFFRLISYYYPLGTDQLIKYHPLLDWSTRGLVYNQNIKWNPEIFMRFGHLITDGSYEYWTQKDRQFEKVKSLKKSDSLTTTFLKNEKYTADKIDKIEKAGGLNFENIDGKFIEKYRPILRKADWKKLAINYRYIVDQKFLSEYWKRDPLDLMEQNENVCWADPSTYKHLLKIKHWMIYKNWIFWSKYLKPVLSDDLLDELISRIQMERKKYLVFWSDEKKGKYMMKIFLEGEHYSQQIDFGYLYSKKPIQKAKVLDFPSKYFIGSVDEVSGDLRNMRTLIFTENVSEQKRIIKK